MAPNTNLETIKKIIVEKFNTMTSEEKSLLGELLARQDALYKELEGLLEEMDIYNNRIISFLKDKKELSEEEQKLLSRLMAIPQQPNPDMMVETVVLLRVYQVKHKIDETQSEILSIFNNVIIQINKFVFQFHLFQETEYFTICLSVIWIDILS